MFHSLIQRTGLLFGQFIRKCLLLYNNYQKLFVYQSMYFWLIINRIQEKPCICRALPGIVSIFNIQSNSISIQSSLKSLIKFIFTCFKSFASIRPILPKARFLSIVASFESRTSDSFLRPLFFVGFNRISVSSFQFS